MEESIRENCKKIYILLPALFGVNTIVIDLRKQISVMALASSSGQMDKSMKVNLEMER
jgi:hypothetical protein